DVSANNVIAEITRAWGTIPRGPEYFQGTPAEPAQISPRLAFREMPGKTYLALFAWPGTTLNDPDVYALDVLATVLSTGETSRLVERLQHKSQLAIDVQASHDTQQNVGGRFVVSAEATPENLEKLQTELLDELYRLREFPVTSAELNRARKQTQAAFVFVEESGQNLADLLAHNYIATGDPNFRAVYLAGIQKVSIEDIRRVAKKYITPETLSKVLITPPGMLPQQIEKGKERIDEEIQAISFPRSKLRLLTKKSNDAPMVNIQFSLLAGSLVETDATAGSCAVLAEMLDKGGQKYSQKEVANYFDSIGSQLVFSTGYNTIRAEATVLKDDLNEALAVMFDAFFNPLLSEEAFQKAQKSILDRIESRSGDPMQEITDLFCQSLPNATAYHLLVNGTTESVKNIKLDDLRQFHQKYFHPDNMVVSIFGDFDTTKAATELNSLLQLKQFAPEAPSISFERTNELIQSISEHKKTERTVALGIVAWPTVSVHAQKEIATLTVLQTILSGYGYPDGKLFNELRQQKLVYYFFIEHILGPVPGYMFATFETHPDRVANVLETIDKQLTDVQQGKLTAEELQAAKKRIIAYHAIQ
ncbi:MAG: insulinase family protein, partial [Planctomycetia bacterium]|nr:insulinase family protein [Planctomycetia bacterium]